MSSRFNDGQPSVISTKRKRMERSLHSLRAVEMTERDPSTTLGMTVGVFGRKRGRSDAFGKDGIAALLHQPTGGAGGSTDANGLDALQPL